MILNKSDTGSADTAALALKQGEIAILPTDTLYGFSGIVPETAKKIREIKGRIDSDLTAKKPFIHLIAESTDIFRYTNAAIPSQLLDLWPGPLTIIVPTLPSYSPTTAFRCPGDDWLRDVIRKTGKPLYSTSVNRAGEAPLTAQSDVIRQFADTVSLIVVAGDYETAIPSTIVDICGNGCTVLRQGAAIIPPTLLSVS